MCKLVSTQVLQEFMFAHSFRAQLNLNNLPFEVLRNQTSSYFNKNNFFPLQLYCEITPTSWLTILAT